MNVFHLELKKKKSSKVRKEKRFNSFIWRLIGVSFLGELWSQGASEFPADRETGLGSSPFHFKWKIQRPKGSFEVGTTGLWDTEGQHPAIEKKCKLKQVPSFHLSDQ